MQTTYKKIAFLSQRADLDDGAFRHYWEYRHGPLVGSSPGYAVWRWRYVQDHPIGPGPDTKAPFDFAGIAEFWLPPKAPTEEEYVKSSVYRDRIAPDEDAFIDKSRTLSIRAREQVLIRGEGPIKLMRLGQWAPGMTDVQVSELHSNLSTIGLMAPLKDWRVDHVVPSSTRLPGAEAAPGLAFDYVETLRFASEADAEAYLHTAAPLRAQVFDRPATTLFVREHVFFSDGVFVG